MVSTDPTGGRKSGKAKTPQEAERVVKYRPYQRQKSGEGHGTNSLSELAVDLTGSLGKGRG